MTLKVSHLVGGYSQIPVLKDVSFEVQPGELVGLIGIRVGRNQMACCPFHDDQTHYWPA